jgi:hypothetical protein
MNKAETLATVQRKPMNKAETLATVQRKPMNKAETLATVQRKSKAIMNEQSRDTGHSTEKPTGNHE